MSVVCRRMRCFAGVGAAAAFAFVTWFGLPLGHHAGMLLNRDLLARAIWSADEYVSDGRTAWVTATDVVLSACPAYELEGSVRVVPTGATAALQRAVVVISAACNDNPPAPDHTQLVAGISALAPVYVHRAIAIPPSCTSLNVCITHNVADGDVEAFLVLRAVPGWRRALMRLAERRRDVIIALLCVPVVLLLRRWLRPAATTPWFLVHAAGDPWWLHLLGGAVLLLMTAVFVVYYHPFRVFINSDMGWNVLEVAYHRWLRDGLVKWWTDRSGALFIFLPQVLLEWCDLKRWVPHLMVLRVQTALCLFLGVAWLGRRTRTFLLVAPLVLLWCAKCRPFEENTAAFSFWIYTVGPVPTLLVMAAFAAFMRALDAQWRWWRWLPVLAVTALAAMLQSPGNVIVLGVWYAGVVVIYASYARACWPRWLGAGVALLLAYVATLWFREWYDHAVHLRAQSPLRAAWSAWVPTLQAFLRVLWQHNPIELVILAVGAAIPLPCAGYWLWTRSRVFSHARLRAVMLELRAACLLSASATAYFLLLAANKWVQINPHPVRYIIPALLLDVCAISFCLQVFVRRLRLRVLLYTAACVCFIACYDTLRVRPRAASPQWQAAQALLQIAPRCGGTLPLLADFWDAYVLGAFDPHRLLTSTFAGEPLSEIMLDKVLAHPRIMVNFSGAGAQQWLVSNAPPQAFVQRASLLVRDIDVPELARRGWHAYRVAAWDEYPDITFDTAPGGTRTNITASPP